MSKNRAKVLLYDIETTPNLAYVWGKYQQDVIQFEEETHLLCFAYKWLGDKKVNVVALPDLKPANASPNNDFMVVAALWKLFNEADVVIAHNGDQFDQKMVNARFLAHGFAPPSPYKSIDTKKIAKRYFRLNSNKLDDLANLLEIGHKAETGGFSLWLGCMQGSKKSWNTMKKYNKQDVVLLEKIYLKLRPWMDNHPGMNLYGDRPDACPKCGGGPLYKRGTLKTTKVGLLQRYQCSQCEGWCQARKAERTDVQFVN